MYFPEAKPYKMFTKMEPETNFNFTEGTTRLLWSSMLLASMKEKKVIVLELNCSLYVIIQMYSHNQYYVMHYACRVTIHFHANKTF